MEPPEQRGQILATGQRIRFTASICASLIQTLLLNGPTTNPPDAPKGISGRWGWGMNINEVRTCTLLSTVLFSVHIIRLISSPPPPPPPSLPSVLRINLRHHLHSGYPYSVVKRSACEGPKNRERN